MRSDAKNIAFIVGTCTENGVFLKAADKEDISGVYRLFCCPFKRRRDVPLVTNKI